MQVQKNPGRGFSKAARDAALLARQANALSRGDIAAPEVFVVRRATLPDPFAWEIRRFGGVVLRQSEALFSSTARARAAGREALAGTPSS